jgi:phenylalanyl-tRNA synthetase beta chain
MKIVQSWLKEYLKFSLPPETVADRLGMLGLEVAHIERPGARYEGFVVGEVLSCEKHPKADRLTVCRVNVGRETLQIVCGAPNVAAGQKVPVGLIGASVPKNQHDPEGKPFVLSRIALRGVESFGMICSPRELDLGTDADGIMVLDPGAKIGQPLAKYLGLDDVVYDIEVSPNRPDWLSHLGVAREIGILVKKTPVRPRVVLKEGPVPIRKFLSVTVEDQKNCPRFAARMIRGVSMGPSPAWLQERLRNAGLRPINNVVDVTNYVMLESGHPLHAFDYALLLGGRIIVRQAAPGSKFTTLDGKEHDLPPGAVMVCDAQREVSIAGVMGGANSEIRETTVDVVLESACWNPANIRRTAKALGISTDASQRFERGADPNGPDYALERAASLVVAVAGGELLRGRIDVYPKKIRGREVTLRVSRTNALLGTSLTKKQISGLAKAAGLGVRQKTTDALLCTVPTFRVDLEREIDLIEEIARVYGYDNIEARTVAHLDLDQPMGTRSTADGVREFLVGAGFMEALSSSMHDESRARLGGAEPVQLLNPLGMEMAFLRASLVPELLDSVRRNQNHGNPDLRFFEIGHVFRVDPAAEGRLVENFYEEERVALLLAGEALPRQWSAPARKADLFDVKGYVEQLVGELALDKARFISYSTSDGLTESSLSIEIHGGYAGYLGRVKEEIASKFGIEGDVIVAELRVSALVPRSVKRFESLPRYPGVRRDISFLVDRSVQVAKLDEAMRVAGGELLVDVDVFDIFEGEKLPAGKKSLAFSLDVMSRQKTLTDSEIEAVVRQVVRALEEQFGAVLRSVH